MLKRCLEQLISYVEAHTECSVTVTDDGDAAKTQQFLGNLPRVKVIQGPRKGPSANRNNGAAQATADLLVFLDDDCIPDPDLISIYQEAAMRAPEISVFEGRISARGEGLGFADSCPENETGGYLWSCNIALKRDTFEQVRGFDERYPFAAQEDRDLYTRVKSCAQVMFLPEARVWHNIDQRPGSRGLRHQALSELLYFHIHGLDAKNQNPKSCLLRAVRKLLVVLPRRLRTGKVKNPMHFIRLLLADLKLATLHTFWKHRERLAVLLYPPCCAGCSQIHGLLRSPAEQLSRLSS